MEKKKVIDEIINLMERAGTRPIETGVPRLSMIKGDIPTHQLTALYKPTIGFTVKGTKILSIGERNTNLEGPSYYLLPIHVPASASVHSDCDGHPYMSLCLELNQDVLQQLLRDLPENQIPTTSEDFAACEIDIEHMEVWLRLLRLTKTPKDIPALHSRRPGLVRGNHRSGETGRIYGAVSDRRHGSLQPARAPDDESLVAAQQTH